MPLNIVVPRDEKPPIVFDGWDLVPRNYGTRAKWDLNFRAVKKGEQAAAAVVHSWTRKLETVDVELQHERFFKLYHFSQTRPVRKTHLKLARREFFRYFVEHSDRSRLIRWTQGEYRTDKDGERWWDSDSDVWGWRTYKEWFDLQKTIDHTTAKDIYGVFGAKSSYYLLIDLDLHKQPLDLFLRRLEVLLGKFHGVQGDCRCHFQVSDSNAGGIHLILFFGAKSSLKSRRRWITRILDVLDSQNPGCEFFKNGKLNIEVYPGNNPHRLPLARGRTMLLDRPLQMLERRGKQTQDIVGYIKWLENPNRSYMSKNEVLWFILDRLDLSSAKWGESSGKERKREQDPNALAGHQQPTQESRSLKHRTRHALVGFWQRGEQGPFPNLNRAVFITLQALHAEGLAEEDAVRAIMTFVDELPNEDISSRLVSGKALIERDAGRDAAKVWSKPVNEKWQAVAEHWASIGFHVSDKFTWDVRSGKLEVVVDCEEVRFTPEERQLLLDQMAPLLVGKKQAQKSEKREVVCKAVAYFLRYVRCCDREIPYLALPLILSVFDLKVKNHDKQRKFLKLLIEWDWLYVRAKYYHPSKHGGRKKTGRATAYGIGKAMVGKFSSTTQDRKKWSYILSPTFYGATESDVEIPSMEEQLSSLCTA